MVKVLIVDADKCTGCRICQLVCSMARAGEFSPENSYIKVLRNKELDINVVTLHAGCDQCGECVQWCPPQALKFVSLEQAMAECKGRKLGTMPAMVVK